MKRIAMRSNGESYGVSGFRPIEKRDTCSGYSGAGGLSLFGAPLYLYSGPVSRARAKKGFFTGV
jgi:hypothetical protein